MRDGEEAELVKQLEEVVRVTMGLLTIGGRITGHGYDIYYRYCCTGGIG